MPEAPMPPTRSRIVHTEDSNPLFVYGTNSKNQTVAVPFAAFSGTGTGDIDSVQAGTNVSVDTTDPRNPVVSASGVLQTVVAGDGIAVDNTDPANPVVSLTNTAPKILQFAVSDETTDLTVGDDQITLRAPQAMTLTSVRASVGTAPTGSNMTIDLKVNGSSILSTKITIEAGEKTSLDATTQPVISSASIADDAEIAVDIDAVGSTIAGAGLKICMKGT